MSAAAGVLAALVVLVLAGPQGRRPVRSVDGARSGDGGPSARTSRGLDAVLVAVAAQLRTGRAPRDAWQTVLGVPLAGEVPSVDLLVATCGPGGAQAAGVTHGHARLRRRRGEPEGADEHAALARDRARSGTARAWRGAGAARERQRLVERATAVVVAARTAHELGAPLVGVLERVTESLAADAAERDDVEAALAGPRATARVLAWLPLLGLALGTLLGADPVGVLLGGGLGTTAGVIGVLLLVAGRRWTAHLLARAARASHAGSGGRPRLWRPAPLRTSQARS